MKITILSQNLQGLNNPSKVDIVRNYFRPLLASIDVLCFQEHKLRGARLTALKDRIWPRAGFFARETTIGYRHLAGEEGAGRGGVCMWIAPQITHLVAGSGHSRFGRS
jgi:exonuclease III